MSRKPQTKLSLSAIYTRRYRERLRTGKVRLPILVDEADLVVMLIDRGLLNPLQADDRAALTAGAEQALRELCETSQHGGATYDKLRLGMCLAAQKRKMMMDGEKKNIKGNSISLLIFPDTEISAMVAAIASEIVPTTAGWRLRCRGKGRRAL